MQAPSSIKSEQLKQLNPLLLPLPWLAVAAIVAVYCVMKFGASNTIDSPPPSENTLFPQFFLTDVDMREFDDKGNLHTHISTPLVRHFQLADKASAEDYTLFSTPHILFTGRADKADWDISADVGRSNNNDEILVLSPNVVATQQSPTQGLVTINTSELQLNSREQFAHTSKAVTMRTAKTTLETVGMHADIKSDQIKLLSKVKGSYEP